ncbi:hypothetical protein FMM66_08915 [[Clostridium] cocleatum]|uniref:hypothetical protein n=1 Tax=Thomasclavelia cocleata TaxID=69824 RepID=UPI00138F7DFA|nr:hypothetical protein [Thomasclavelia cocleata]MCR1960781.1 hypothetical protein [Thomasclavelia cocleata]NDO42559.1 hypothetical protein [Thomasclavelia cocleata]
MKVVNVKFRHGIDRPIRSGQPVYSFMCPIDTIEAGDYVLTEVAIKKGKNKNDFFQVARVEKVMEVTDYREKVSEDGTDPSSYFIKFHLYQVLLSLKLRLFQISYVY